jgi:hypothetical protein
MIVSSPNVTGLGGRGTPAGLAHEESPGSNVPRLNAKLPIPIQPPQRRPGTIQRGRTQTAHALRTQLELGKLGQVVPGIGADTVLSFLGVSGTAPLTGLWERVPCPPQGGNEEAVLIGLARGSACHEYAEGCVSGPGSSGETRKAPVKAGGE